MTYDLYIKMERASKFASKKFRSSRPEVFCKKLPLEISQNSQENTCGRVSFLRDSGIQVFSCEFCDISKNTFYYRTPQVAASVNGLNISATIC